MNTKQQLKKDLEWTAFLLIKAMLEETEKMPRAFEAPKTVNHAGVLRSILVELDYKFEGGAE